MADCSTASPSLTYRTSYLSVNLAVLCLVNLTHTLLGVAHYAPLTAFVVYSARRDEKKSAKSVIVFHRIIRPPA